MDSSLFPPDTALDREQERQAVLDSYQLAGSGTEQAFDDIVRLVTRLCDAPASTVALVDRDRQWFKAGIGVDCSSTPRRLSICDFTIRSRDPLVLEDVARDPRFDRLPVLIGGQPVRFYAGVPVFGHGGHAVGTLCAMDVRPRTLSDAQMDSLRILARQTEHLLELRWYGLQQRRIAGKHAWKLHKAEVAQRHLQQEMAELARSARLDPLTGLLNRAGLQELRGDAAALARLDAGPYCLLVLDIDHFKQINDTHGHREGDRALRAVADVVEASIRHDDVAVRFGGEEFLVVLPATSVGDALEVAERIRTSVAGLALPFPVSVSAGIAAGEPARSVPESVFEEADRALYRAKEAGRDRVIVAGH